MCTAMRRGDCCLLKWESVDLPRRFIRVKTSKTGESVQIPIFPLLEGVLKATPHKDSEYVFPEHAAMYENNPDGITLRVRKVLENAGFADLADEEADPEDVKNANGAALVPVSRGALHQERKNGLRRASVRDFHSFRVTWVTLALTAGVPMELVQRVTGHRTAQIVQKHYFQPGEEDFRKALAGKLPTLMAGGSHPAPLDPNELREKLKAMNPKNWQTLRDEILALL
jgi:integrase